MKTYILGQNKKIDDCLNYFKEINDKYLFEEFQSYTIAGGCILSFLSGQQVKDVDIFPSNKWVSAKLRNKLEQQGFLLTRETSNSKLYSNKDISFDIVMCQTDDFGGARSFIDSKFDFTICKAFITDKFQELVTCSTYFDDIRNQRIVVDNVQPLAALLVRLNKYSMKGFYLSRDSANAIAEHYSEIPELLSQKIETNDGYEIFNFSI